jgi:hypothetical protein
MEMEDEQYERYREVDPIIVHLLFGKISLLVLCAQKREKKEKKNLRSAKRVAFNINITREG